jgi:hypothetical protein
VPTDRQIKRAAARHLKRADRIRTADSKLDRSSDRLEEIIEDPKTSAVQKVAESAYVLGGMAVTFTKLVVTVLPGSIRDTDTLELSRLEDFRKDETMMDFMVRRLHGIDLQLELEK